MGANEWLGGNYVKVDAKADSDALFKNPKAEAVQAEAAKNAAEAAKSRQYDAPLPERLLHWTIVLAAQGAWVGFAYSAVAKCLAPGCACSWYNLVTGFVFGSLVADGLTTMTHFSLDNYGDENTPIVGLPIKYFREHHDYPSHMFRRDFVGNGWSEHLYALVVLSVSLLCGLVSLGESSPFTLMAWAAAGMWGCQITAIHKAAHTTRPVFPYNLLQSYRVIIGRKYHQTHHANFSSHHALCLGWVDVVIQWLYIIPILESAVYFFTGRLAVNSALGLVAPARATFGRRYEHVKWVVWYNVFDDLCRRQSLDLHFMNWGYADIANVSDKDTVDQIDASASKADPRAKDVLVQPIPIAAEAVSLPAAPRLKAIDSASLQLYLQLLRNVDVRGKDIVEISSGKGGGIAAIAAGGESASCTGVDLCIGNVQLCQEKYAALCAQRDPATTPLRFIVGDACGDNGLAPGSVDIILNVEASHCYPSRMEFYKRCYETLAPGGLLLQVDFMDVRGDCEAGKDSGTVRTLIEEAGFTFRKDGGDRDISKHVLSAMAVTDVSKRTLIKEHSPAWMSPFVNKFAATKNSTMWARLLSGDSTYHMFRAVKPGKRV